MFQDVIALSVGKEYLEELWVTCSEINRTTAAGVS